MIPWRRMKVVAFILFLNPPVVALIFPPASFA
jgi:hypothetical protein